jgi:hypothetical protein
MTLQDAMHVISGFAGLSVGVLLAWVLLDW